MLWGGMTWYVKWKRADGQTASNLADDESKVVELFDEARAKGFEPWIEDANGVDMKREHF